MPCSPITYVPSPLPSIPLMAVFQPLGEFPAASSPHRRESSCSSEATWRLGAIIRTQEMRRRLVLFCICQANFLGVEVEQVGFDGCAQLYRFGAISPEEGAALVLVDDRFGRIEPWAVGR